MFAQAARFVGTMKEALTEMSDRGAIAMPASGSKLAETTAMIARRAAEQSEAVALLDRRRRPLTYSALSTLVERVGQQLVSLGLRDSDRVAIVLPNGPEMAACFLCVAGVATAAPLNPDYRRGEFDFYLADLRARALIIAQGMPSPAREAAAALSIPIIELKSAADDAGQFELIATELIAAHAAEADPRPEAALVLHTSGTTARPKIVPLTQANLCASARSVAASLELTAADRCLNVMPLFHIHGLVGALLSTIHAGGSVICAGPFDATGSLAAMTALRPTWYTAVPTMHQAILTVAGSGPGIAHHLRFIRSCSSALAPTLLAKLEQAFGVPVVEAYGMTEAAHQMCCNPLPPCGRKPGSVGVPTGVAVAIMDPAGQLLPPGVTGEVVIRGPSVSAGYEDNPQANFAAFEHGWFHTGDQGRLDEDGYLYLTGRIKELINRGGEKISPREIDEALLTHPDVAQAIAFAVPHATLGEDVAAAVVARPGCTLDSADVRRHVAGRLAEFKTPRRVLVVPEIPKGPTGKPQRIGLAEKLGLTGESESASAPATELPQTTTEVRLAAIWARVLERREFSRTDDFFGCGGDSLSATMLLALIESEFHVALPIRTLFESRSLADMGAAIDQLPLIDGVALPTFESLVPFQPHGNRTPFFMVHGHSGRSVGLGFIAPHLDADQPFYGFVARGMDGRRLPHRTVVAMAADYVREIRQLQPHGPYLLGGFCAGGMVAFEMAQQLLRGGESVARLVLVDTAHPSCYVAAPRWLQAARTAKLAARRIVMGALLRAGRAPKVKLGERIVNETMRRGAATYIPQPYAGRITLVRSDTHPRTDDPLFGWDGVAALGVDRRRFAGDHAQAWTRERIAPAAREIQACLTAAAAERIAAKSAA
jgi:acyl-CoA synthetase (AMP-forming)/AMP-acid ligase II/thioesterase domain-containing protein/acyl carrier protein